MNNMDEINEIYIYMNIGIFLKNKLFQIYLLKIIKKIYN